MIRPPEVTLRLLEVDELDAWLALRNATCRACPGFEPLVRLDYIRRQMRGDVDPSSPLVAVHGAELAGGISFAAGRQSRRGRLSDLTVHPEARQRGLGEALVAAALAELRARGVTIVQAQDWAAAEFDDFYRRLGFRRAGRYRLLAWDLLEGVTRAQPEPAVEIRRATAADVSGLAAVFATVDLPDRFWGRSFEDLEDLRHPALWASDVPASGGLQQTCWVAVEGETIVGAIVTRIDSALNQAAGRRDGYFDRGGVAVLPAHRARAIGQRLVLAGLDHFRAQGLARGLTWAYSPLEGDTPAITLCRDCGARELACHMAWEIDWPG